MKINDYTWNLVQDALKAVPTKEKEELGINKCIAKLYLTAIRLWLCNEWISNKHNVVLKMIAQISEGYAYLNRNMDRQQWAQALTFVYGIQVGLKLARQRIDYDCAKKCSARDESYLEGYSAARAAIGRYKYLFGETYPKKRKIIKMKNKKTV